MLFLEMTRPLVGNSDAIFLSVSTGLSCNEGLILESVKYIYKDNPVVFKF